MKTLSVVCARAGSTGVKNKCIRKLNGRMIVEYSIDYPLALGKHVKTVVSTDDVAILAYCMERGVDVIHRDPELCKDNSKIEDVLADAIHRYGESFTYCNLVYGNIPTRYPNLFAQGINFLETNPDFDAVISMQHVEKYHPNWMFDLSMEQLPVSTNIPHRRQLLSPKMIHDGHTLIFRINGFIGRYDGFIEYNKDVLYAMFGSKIKPDINDEIIIDIDSEKDMRLAEAVFRSFSK